MTQSVRSNVWELPAAELAATKRETARMKRALPRLKAPRDARRRWDYLAGERGPLKPIEAAYAAAIDEAEEDDQFARAYANRAAFRSGTGDFAGARDDLDAAIEHAAIANYYSRRSSAKYQLGDLEGALADAEMAESLVADGGTHWFRVQLNGLLGRTEDALAVAEDFALVSDDLDDAEWMRAHALGWAGQADEGLLILQGISDEDSEDASKLNNVCWHAGIWDLVDEDILEVCTAAVERGGVSAAARDSRALALHRLGRSQEAVAELGEVLISAPDQHDSRYLRGIIRLALGDKGGQEDVKHALWASPANKDLYAAYGLTAS